MPRIWAKISLSFMPPNLTHPHHQRKTQIAFSDGSNSTIEFLSRDGADRGRLDHTRGGGRPFDIFGDKFAVQGVLSYRLSVYNRSGRVVANVFPIGDDDGELLLHTSGGGVAFIDSVVYMMNALEPRIFAYDLSADSENVIVPREWQALQGLQGTDQVSQLSFEEWSTNSSKYASFYKFDKVALSDNNDDVLVAAYTLNDNNYIDILTLEGHVLHHSEFPGWFFGTNGNLIHFVEAVDGTTSRFRIISYSLERLSLP